MSGSPASDDAIIAFTNGGVEETRVVGGEGDRRGRRIDMGCGGGVAGPGSELAGERDDHRWASGIYGPQLLISTDNEDGPPIMEVGEFGTQLDSIRG